MVTQLSIPLLIFLLILLSLLLLIPLPLTQTLPYLTLPYPTLPAFLPHSKPYPTIIKVLVTVMAWGRVMIGVRAMPYECGYYDNAAMRGREHWWQSGGAEKLGQSGGAEKLRQSGGGWAVG